MADILLFKQSSTDWRIVSDVSWALTWSGILSTGILSTRPIGPNAESSIQNFWIPAWSSKCDDRIQTGGAVWPWVLNPPAIPVRSMMKQRSG